MSKTAIETVECNLCGSTKHKLLFPDRGLSQSGKNGIVRCLDCGLVYRHIRLIPLEIFRQYESREYNNLSKDWIEKRKNIFLPYVENVGRFRKYGRILDIGCGHGFFLKNCLDAGWECYGLEPSQLCRTFAHDKFGLELKGCSLDEAGYEPDFFDVVTFWNVLDHLYNPKKTLEITSKILRHGGAVFIRLPNVRFHVAAKKIFQRCPGLIKALTFEDQSVFHLFSFSEKTIARMLETTGFEKTKVLPARLGWSTIHDAENNYGRTFMTGLADYCARFLFFLLLKQYVFAPSIIVTAESYI